MKYLVATEIRLLSLAYTTNKVGIQKEDVTEDSSLNLTVSTYNRNFEEE